MTKFIIFGQDKSLFALALGSVREVLFFNQQLITPVPNTLPFLLGITNLRGEIIAVMDFGHFIGIKDRGLSGRLKILPPHQPGTVDWHSPDCRILVVEAPDPNDVRLLPMRMGLAVSFVEGVVHLNTDRIVSAQEVSEELAPFLRGLYEDRGRLLMIVDIEAISLTRDRWVSPIVV
ncbi:MULTISPECIES: chemotaxis protein CheW [Aerosakkonema]|uniref:chemotaxis protein CheW n=1 Tax=Aerosakkonema TaxID=1246629 RepID=UPI0035B8EBFA